MSIVSATEAARLAGCTYRQLDYWMRRQVFEPRVSACGSGTRRKFDPRDVEALAACADLSRYVASTDAFRAVATAVLRQDIEPGDFVWIRGRSVGRTRDIREALVEGQGPVMVLPLRTFDAIRAAAA